MVKKLTLTVDESTIEKAKIYAQNTGRSLSGIVENYLKTLVFEDNEIEIEENIARLSIQLPENFDEDKELREYLEKKHF
ncbi:DUF6364 family protein [Aquiflexum lacus]|uniref:DUF6364 family protein n=1 Tax=Aquiflexum lacus TaxID=2483805 RepID=UPI001895D431|nr:DUF6364 family protein [Aquiflexum lacus]